MTTTVEIYDTWYEFDLTQAYNIDIHLIASSYTFDATNADFTADIAPDEVTDTGYVSLSGASIALDSGATGLTGYQLLAGGSAPSFAPFSTSDYRYAVLVNDATGAPLLCIDTGTVNALVAQGLSISGVLLTVGV